HIEREPSRSDEVLRRIPVLLRELSRIAQLFQCGADGGVFRLAILDPKLDHLVDRGPDFLPDLRPLPFRQGVRRSANIAFNQGAHEVPPFRRIALTLVSRRSHSPASVPRMSFPRSLVR